MTETLYRGTTLTSALLNELGTGSISGSRFEIYKGRIAAENPGKAAAKGVSVDDIDWWTPEGFDGDPYLTETVDIVGGLSDSIGTAIGFARGVPIVFYLDRSKLSRTPTPVQYRLDWFDRTPGALAWVSEEDGEVRGEDAGLFGLTTNTENGPQVWEWGDTLASTATTYQDESEQLAFTRELDVSGAIMAAAVMLEGRRTVKQALATFDGYHAGFGGDDETLPPLSPF